MMRSVPIAAGALLAQRYRAETLLGRGGMGEVWLCRDLEQEREVAIKAVRADFLADPGAARLFHAEIVATARLNHPGIVPVYDLVRDPGGPTLLVMAYRDGPSLGSFRPADLTWPFVAEVLKQLLEALAYAHARGVLHLDIKPENVLVERRGSRLRATLLDFGISRIRRPGRGSSAGSIATRSSAPSSTCPRSSARGRSSGSAPGAISSPSAPWRSSSARATARSLGPRSRRRWSVG